MTSEHIGTRILRARDEAKLTQEQLGIRAGVTSSAISRFETGKRNPRKSTVIAIAAALGLEPEVLKGEVAA